VNGQRLSYPDLARIFGTGLISTGVGLLLFVAITIVWGDPFTRLSEQSAQKELAQSFDAVTSGPLRASRLDPRLTHDSALAYKRSRSVGQVVGHMKIPKIGFDKYIVKGASQPALARGPGIYDETQFPGNGAPVAIAGHRTTHGAPFLNIDDLDPGDKIVIDMPYGRFTYSVTKTRIITPTDWSIIKPGAAGGSRRCIPGSCEHLVMTACHPKYSASKRIAVFSRLEKVQLRKSKF
jgi:sortase A